MKNNPEITFCMAEGEGFIAFTVPTIWATNWISKNYSMSLIDFIDSYTSYESQDMYGDAILQNKVIKEIKR